MGSHTTLRTLSLCIHKTTPPKQTLPINSKSIRGPASWVRDAMFFAGWAMKIVQLYLYMTIIADVLRGLWRYLR